MNLVPYQSQNKLIEVNKLLQSVPTGILVKTLAQIFEKNSISPDDFINIRHIDVALSHLKDWMKYNLRDGSFCHEIMNESDELNDIIKWSYVIHVNNIGYLVARVSFYDPFLLENHSGAVKASFFMRYFEEEVKKANFVVEHFNSFANFAKPTFINDFPIDEMVENLLDTAYQLMLKNYNSVNEDRYFNIRHFYSVYDIIKRLPANSANNCHITFDVFDNPSIGWFDFSILLRNDITPMKLLLFQEGYSYISPEINIQEVPDRFTSHLIKARNTLRFWNKFVNGDLNKKLGPKRFGGGNNGKVRSRLLLPKV